MAGTYDQYCAVAAALDVVGDRWTLLLVRELLDGPRRNSALAEGLPGIATNLLAERLRKLEAHDVVEQVPDDDARVRTYRLTARGRELEPVVVALARFGLDELPDEDTASTFRPAWVALALRLLLDPGEAGDDLVLRVEAVRPGEAPEPVLLRLGPAGAEVVDAGTPDVVLRGDPAALVGSLRDPHRARELAAAGRVTVEGEPGVRQAFLRMLDTARPR